MGHVTSEELKRNVYRVLVEKTDGGNFLGELLTSGWIILSLQVRASSYNSNKSTN
jgi:hypothetical protein